MKKRLAGFLLLLLLVSLRTIDSSGSFLADQETITGNTFSAGCWEEGLDCVSGSPLTTLRFYAQDDKHAVGFRLSGVASYNLAEYKVQYTRDGEAGDIEEVVVGSLDNSSAEDELTYEWIILGTCSSDGACVFHEGVETVAIEVILKGVVERTLSTQISL